MADNFTPNIPDNTSIFTSEKKKNKGWKPSEKEQETLNKVSARFEDAKSNWIYLNRDRFDQYYKNFRDYGEDRLQKLKQIGGQNWMSNIFVPLTASHIRTVHPRVIESRPEMKVLGRTQLDHEKALKVQGILEYLWEKSEMDKELRDIVWTALVYGTSWGKVIWSVKKRAKYKSDINKANEDPELLDGSIYYDDPDFEAVDAYDLFPDPAATDTRNWRYVCQRYVMTKEQILKTWPNLQNMDYVTPGGDLTNLKLVRRDVPKTKFSEKRKNSIVRAGTIGTSSQRQAASTQKDLVEVIEYWEDDRLVVVANGVLIKDISNPYPTKEIPYVRLVYEDLPFEMYGVGIAEQLEQVQYAINTIRNQRIDNVTMSVHKMFIVNPLALVDENDLTTRPFGLIRTPDPKAVVPIEFGDIKASAFNEDSLMIETAKFATGIDDFSRGIGGPASLTATAVTAQKESTSDRVKNFVRNIETEVFEKTMRLWLSYIQEFYPTKTLRRINDTKDGMDEVEVLDVPIRTQKNGNPEFPIIEKDDIMGFFDFRVASNSTVAGTQDLKLKKLNELMDRAIQGGIDPATGQPLVNMKGLWEDLFFAYGLDPQTLLYQEGDKTPESGPAMSGDISKGQQLPEGVEPTEAALALLGGGTLAGPETGTNLAGSAQARPGGITPPPQIPELRADLPINLKKPDSGIELSEANQP